MSDPGNPFLNDPTTGGGPSLSQLDKLFQIPSTYNALPVARQADFNPNFRNVDIGGMTVPNDEPQDMPGVPGLGDTSNFSVQQLLQHLESLPADELRQVQAQLANAGYYGAMKTPSDEPTWGYLTTKDVNAFRQFVLDGIQAGQNGQSLTSLLAAKTKQFSANQQTEGGKPVFDLGKDYTIDHLDQASVNSDVDSIALKTLGHGLSDKERAQIYSKLDADYVGQQTSQMAADQARRHSDAAIQAGTTTDANGNVVDFNSITGTARSLIGKVPYLWGGASPSGADCSGLTALVYAQAGLNIGHGTSAQWANKAGVEVTPEGAQPGDLVFFGSPTDNLHAHVGIYIGNGMMIDNAHTGTSTRVDSITGFGMPLLGFKHFNVPGSAPPPASTVVAHSAPGIGVGGTVDVGGMSIPISQADVDSGATGVPSARATVGNSGTAARTTAGGKQIVTTPDTVTPTVKMDTAARIAEEIRRAHPDESAAHDFSNAYGQFVQILKGAA